MHQLAHLECRVEVGLHHPTVLFLCILLRGLTDVGANIIHQSMNFRVVTEIDRTGDYLRSSRGEKACRTELLCG